MKNIMMFCCVLFVGCQVEDNTPAVPVIEDTFDTDKATLVKQGSLQGIGHTATGVASVYELDGKFAVVLDPYTSQNGPDLKVYLSKDVDASEYIRLGNLKATMGKQTYPVPEGTELEEYDFVHVWCEKYTVVFARAEVK